MKKALFKLIGTSLLTLTCTGIFAQQSGSASATLNVNLQDARSISVGNSNIELNFTTVENYRNGVTVNLANHLQVISSTGFQIKVSSGEFLIGPGQNNNIPANTITVSPSVAGTSNLDIAVTPQRLGSATGLTVAKCSSGTLPLFFNVAYKTDPDAYIGKKSEVYTTTVTYEITSL